MLLFNRLNDKVMKTLKSVFESDLPEYINEGFKLEELYELWRFFGVNEYFFKSAFDFAKIKAYLNKNGLLNSYEDGNDYSKTTANRLNLIGSLVSSININNALDWRDEKPVAELIKNELSKFSKCELDVRIEVGFGGAEITITRMGNMPIDLLRLKYYGKN